MKQFSKTEAYRRIASLAREAKRLEGLPNNVIAEVGTRWSSVHLDHYPEDDYDAAIADDDDLDDLFHPYDAAGMDVHKQPGAVVHIYIRSSATFDRSELVDVYVGWMGTHDEPARLILRPMQ